LSVGCIEGHTELRWIVQVTAGVSHASYSIPQLSVVSLMSITDIVRTYVVGERNVTSFAAGAPG